MFTPISLPVPSQQTTMFFDKSEIPFTRQKSTTDSERFNQLARALGPLVMAGRKGARQWILRAETKTMWQEGALPQKYLALWEELLVNITISRDSFLPCSQNYSEERYRK